MGLLGLTRSALTRAMGRSWWSTSSLRLDTSPSRMGSKPVSKTIGILAVAAFAASAAGVEVAAITTTWRRTRSAAIAGRDFVEQLQLLAEGFHSNAEGQPCDVPVRARETLASCDAPRSTRMPEYQMADPSAKAIAASQCAKGARCRLRVILAVRKRRRAAAK